MRGPDIHQDTLFSTVSPADRVPKDHPLRPIRQLVDTALLALDEDFDALYAEAGRDSIPPEKLLRAQLMKAPLPRKVELRRAWQDNGMAAWARWKTPRWACFPPCAGTTGSPCSTAACICPTVGWKMRPAVSGLGYLKKCANCAANVRWR